MPTARHEAPTDCVKIEDDALPATTEQEQSFVQRYEILFPRLCEFAASYLDSDGALDAVQQAMGRLWSRRKKIAIGNRPDAFYYGAVRKQIAFMERSAVRQSRKFAGYLRQIRLPSQRRESPDVRLARAEVNAIVKTALATMTARSREVWTLMREHDLTYDEISAALEITPSSARWYMMEARRHLQRPLIDAGYVGATAIAPPPVPRMLSAPAVEDRDHD